MQAYTQAGFSFQLQLCSGQSCVVTVVRGKVRVINSVRVRVRVCTFHANMDLRVRNPNGCFMTETSVPLDIGTARHVQLSVTETSVPLDQHHQSAKHITDRFTLLDLQIYPYAGGVATMFS